MSQLEKRVPGTAQVVKKTLPDAELQPVKPKTPAAEIMGSATTPMGGQNQNAGALTFDQLIALQQQEGAADREARANGENFVRYGGGYSSAPQEGSVQLEKPMYDDLYYYNPGEKRYIQEGTAGADETFMSREDYALVQEYKKQWADANARGDTAAAQLAHEAAEAIRAKYGYSGDTKTRTDGGGYTTLGQRSANSYRPTDFGDTGVTGGNGGNGADDLTGLLEEWKKAAAEQANGQIDYAVSQAIAQLERALEDSKAQYKEQAEGVARDEMQGLDNSALYAEMRGDKGGIGQSQYNEIQAAAAQNRLAVQQAQTKLATDTARQIADLRAQGEFEKADKALEITQQYLSQLIPLEQWAAEFGLSQQQFQASLDQWQAEFDLAMKEFDYNVAANERDYNASMAEALLAAGIPLDDEQLKAIGMSRDQYNEYLRTMEMKNAAGSPAEEQPVGDTASTMTLADLGKNAREIYDIYSNGTGIPTPALMASLIDAAGDSISEDEAKFLLSLVGY